MLRKTLSLLALSITPMQKLMSILCLAAMLLYFPARAQKTLFSHAAGVAFYGADDYFSAGLMYAPRINFAVLSETSTFSVGTHLGLGGSFDYNYNSYYGTQNSVSFFADIPLVVEYNFGNAATRVAYKKFGGFIGGGYGWHAVTHSENYGDDYYDDYDYRESATVHGPVINGGFRFPIGRASFGVRVSYLFNDNKDDVYVDGIGSLAMVFNIGSWVRKR